MFWLVIYLFSIYHTHTHTHTHLPVVLARRTTADFCAMSAKRPVIGILCVFMYNEDEREKTFFFLCRGGMYSAQNGCTIQHDVIEKKESFYFIFLFLFFLFSFYSILL
jgi:hypothetical protein